MFAEEPSAKVVLSAPLVEWKQEIEAARPGRLVVARIHHDAQRNAVMLPRDIDRRPVLVRYFRNPSFVREFLATHAMNLNHQGPEGRIYFVLLNMARAAEWGEHEEAVLAHEFGHVWLFARHFPFPEYQGQADSCAAIVGGDAVQHIVIRAEMRRRGIQFLPYWIANLEKTLAALEGDASLESLPRCRRLSQVSVWLDVRMGLPAEEWPLRDRLIAALTRRFPDLEPAVDDLYSMLAGQNVHEYEIHEQVLKKALLRVYALFDTLAGQ